MQAADDDYADEVYTQEEEYLPPDYDPVPALNDSNDVAFFATGSVGLYDCTTCGKQFSLVRTTAYG
ncbi:hypothetical protein Ct61P_14661 [Colletotrichum tofieldiae]|nr:hypothetical protein Ct61P_14661 [Colletotrichum tofieldiae]